MSVVFKYGFGVLDGDEMRICAKLIHPYLLHRRRYFEKKSYEENSNYCNSNYCNSNYCNRVSIKM